MSAFIRRLGPFIGLALMVQSLVVFGPNIARAAEVSFQGLSTGAANSLYCRLVGCTMTGQTVYSGVAVDTTTVGNEDYTVAPAGTGSFVFRSGDDSTEVQDSAGAVKGEIATNTGSSTFSLSQNLSSGARLRLSTSYALMGRIEDATASQPVTCFGDAFDTGGGGNCLFIVYGTGMFAPQPQTALTISGTPDVTRTPTSAGSACRFSAAAGQSWTPAETNVADGMEACCTNTGVNSVTITPSSGVFEGGGGAVAQWKTICMDYVTDRWVQRGSISP